ncbi:AMP-binding protein [Pseudohaliea sp.]|uniref:AMP-binding protein n=1 Tax=Pseudohaliea sp. TaxID=2740289 RepID=UPI0032ED7A07
MYVLTEFLKSNALATPTSPATRHLGRERTWVELQDRVARLASAMTSMGIAPGDRVAILALNTDRYLEYYFAVWWCGAAVVPMNTRWSASENVFALKNSEATTLFIDAAFANQLPELRQDTLLQRVIYIGDGDVPANTLCYETLIKDHEPIEAAPSSGDTLAGLYYTGGTTGFPKGVMLSHQALWFNNLCVGGFSTYLKGDAYLHVGPMFHLADGAFSGAASTWGVCHTFLPAFEPKQVMDHIEHEQITHTLMVPTMLGMLIAHPDFNPERLRSLRYVVYGASPMPEGVMVKLLELMPWVNWIQGYGQTEMAPAISLLEPEYHSLKGTYAGKLKSAGRAAPGVELRICDEAGNDVPNGQVGEIVARSPGSMIGYWNLPEQTAQTLDNGWVRTGDGAYRDDDGFIFIVDRLKDMIVSGGENVFSAEVENALSTHPAVAGVAVIGIPDEQWGEAVHAIVILEEGMEEAEAVLIAYAKTRIAGYKCPRSISFRSEPFPLSGAGKVLKTELRKPFWADQAKGVS